MRAWQIISWNDPPLWARVLWHHDGGSFHQVVVLLDGRHLCVCDIGLACMTRAQLGGQMTRTREQEVLGIRSFSNSSQLLVTVLVHLTSRLISWKFQTPGIPAHYVYWLLMSARENITVNRQSRLEKRKERFSELPAGRQLFVFRTRILSRS